MPLSKLEMSQVIVQSLHVLKDPAEADHPTVIKLSRLSTATIQSRHELALLILALRKRIEHKDRRSSKDMSLLTRKVK